MFTETYKSNYCFTDKNPNWDNRWSDTQRNNFSIRVSGENNHNFNKIWINNGSVNHKIPKNETIPYGWNSGKLTFNKKQYNWITNGIINRQLEINHPIPEGFKIGTINKKHKKKELFLCNIQNKKQYDKCVASRVFPNIKHLFS